MKEGLWPNSNVLVYQVEKGSTVLVGFCQLDANLGISRKRQSQLRNVSVRFSVSP